MNYKEVIESRYNRQNWQLLLHDIFGNKIKFWNTPSAIPTSSQFAKQALWLGTITLSDNQTISIYEVELSDSVDIERNRRGIRDMLLTEWRNNGNAGAFMFCYRKNESVLRFSYVSEAWTFADDGTYQKESTDAKRFTYLLGEGHRSRTAIQQFEKLRDSSLTLKDLTKAFSVDAVSDMFFDGYKKQYEDIIQYITGKRMVKVANKWEEQIKNDPCEEIMQEFAHFPNPEKAVRDYVKKLMGRLVFLQFLQKKGWLGVPAGAEWGTGDAEFIQTLFAQCQDKDHFIDNVLEPLFNDLNTEREGDNCQLSIVNCQFKVPYLNGGLFERDATDETEFPLPAKYMQSLLDFFASYNFTIDENDPDDAEVGVDPEMLGRIFENLLEDNKDKGAFYTPKEIVSYMCRESLIAYLQTDIEDEPTKEAIRQFVITHDVNALGTNDRSAEGRLQGKKFRQQVDEALKNVKICDPAIGSGAFPMGLLKELFLCRTALEGIDQSKAAEIKKHIIQQNIYGVDIERGAVDIARLRFWLSLIVDEETPQALPNLDFKIMQGNSLLEQYKGVDLSKLLPEKVVDKQIGLQATFFDEEFGLEQIELQELLDNYYDCTQHEKKKELRNKISQTIQKQIHDRGIRVDFVNLDLSGNNQFFLWHTWFHDVFSQGGFDIVIGNPPYVKEYTNRAAFDGFRETSPYYMGKMDLWYGFACHGIDMLKYGGVLCFIAQNNWTTSSGAKLMRKKVIDDTQIMQMLDFHTYMVFEDADIQTMIMLFRHDKVIDSYSIDYRCLNTEGKREDMLLLMEKKFGHTKYLSPIICRKKHDAQVLTFSENDVMLDKIAEGKIYLQSNEVTQGIIGNPDDAFKFSTNDLASFSQLELGHIHKFYTHTNRYYIDDSNVYVAYLSAKSNPNLDIDSIPNIKRKLLLFEKELKSRREVLNRRFDWFFMHWPRNEETFKAGTEKIVTQVRCEYPKFCYTCNEFYGSRALFFIQTSRWDMKALIGILNSKLIEFWLKNKGKIQGALLKLDKDPLLNIPLPCPNTKNNSRYLCDISTLAEKIIKTKLVNYSTNTSMLESKIDSLVYHLYGLSYDDVLIVDPETPIKREEYEFKK